MKCVGIREDIYFNGFQLQKYINFGQGSEDWQFTYG